MSDEMYASGSEESPREQAFRDDGRTPLALAAGLVAALVAGGIWAGLVIVTDMEIGYAAWGVGVLVGWAMTRVTVRRTQQLALAAAAFAILGLAAGKAFIFAGSTGAIAAEVEQDDDMLAGAVAWQMYEANELDAATIAAVDATRESGDTLSDALWSQMTEQATARLATMTQDEKHEMALVVSRGIQSNLGLIGGIGAQLSPFDALWLLLAVGTAYRMLAPAKDEVMSVEPNVPA